MTDRSDHRGYSPPAAVYLTTPERVHGAEPTAQDLERAKALIRRCLHVMAYQRMTQDWDEDCDATEHEARLFLGEAR